MKLIKLYVNKKEVEVAVNPQDTLLTVMRDYLNLNSPKCGCNRGDCGSCTVILDGRAVKSCTVLALTCEGKRVVTTEGIGDPRHLHPIQEAFLEYGAPQCGYCTPGIIMAIIAYLEDNPKPTDEEIKDALAGNLCRCGGYKEYIQAIQAAVNGEFGPMPKGSDIYV